MDTESPELLELYRNIVEDQTEMLVRAKPDATLLYVSDNYCSYFGKRREDLIGSRFLPLVHPDDKELVEARIAGLSQQNPVATGEHRVLTEDGRLRWNQWTNRAIFDDEGRVVALQSVGRDITRQKESELALRDSQDRYRRRYENGPIMAQTCDPKWRLLAVSNRWLSKLGYEREEVLGRPFPEFLTEDSRAHADELGLPDSLLAGATLEDEIFQCLHKNGTVLDVEISTLVETDAEGSFVALHFVTRDITPRRAAERERETALDEIGRLRRELELERDYLREEVETRVRERNDIIGESPALGQTLARIDAVAPTPASVLVLGESGVGKELVARTIHERSRHASGPMIKVNCASIPRDLFESEFFGHARGAFTGATRDRVGRFELANGGTIFLDEVAEIPSELQAKLLRVLQEGELERIGETRTRKIDVRVISATNRNLEKEVAEGRFREDLYYRLSVFPLQVPPLRERRVDIVPLARHFLIIACRDFGREPLALSRAQAATLEEYDWPGNARELRNFVERAVILSPGDRLRLDLALAPTAIVPRSANGESSPTAADDAPHFLTEEEMRARERANLIAALEHCGWRVSGKGGAADCLGLKVSTVSYRMKVFDIQRPE